MHQQLLKDGLLWGLLLWLIGYLLGFVFFMLVPKDLIGWVIMPIGIAITTLILVKKIHGDSLRYYLYLAIMWTVIAVICDYLFLVRVLKPADGYYKPDVYLYYLTTFLLPLLVGKYKLHSPQ